MDAAPKRKRGRPPFTRQEQIERVARRFVLLWIRVRHLQAEAHVAGMKSPRKLALEVVAADCKMSVHTLRNLLKKGLKGVPANVRALLAPRLPGLRETYRVYAEAKANEPALHAAQAKKRAQAERLLAELSPFDRALKEVAAKWHVKTASGESKQMHEFELVQWLQNGRPERMPDEVRALLRFLKRN